MGFLVFTSMQYVQQLSERALNCLAILKRPTWKDIWKQRTEDSIGDVGTEFSKILDKMGISMNVLRRLLQKELYGIVGVFFRTLDITHSSSLVLPDCLDEKISNHYNKAIKRIKKEGFNKRFSTNGSLYKSRTKKSHPKQQGLYLPESILENIERAIDNEERLFIKNFDSNSLEVLEYVFKRSLELRKNYGDKWYPIFSDKSIERDTGINLDRIKKSTKNLVGILCESYQTKNCRVWQKRYFLPSSRFSDVKYFLS